MDENCGNCRFMRKAGAYECRKALPSMDENGTAAWPKVTVEDWCGNYERKAEPVPAELVPEAPWGVDHLECSTRVFNVMKAAGITDIRVAAAMTDSELLVLPEFGRGSLKDFRESIEQHKRDYPEAWTLAHQADTLSVCPNEEAVKERLRGQTYEVWPPARLLARP